MGGCRGGGSPEFGSGGGSPGGGLDHETPDLFTCVSAGEPEDGISGMAPPFGRGGGPPGGGFGHEKSVLFPWPKVFGLPKLSTSTVSIRTLVPSFGEALDQRGRAVSTPYWTHKLYRKAQHVANTADKKKNVILYVNVL